jgi:uncharacterized membrane protein YbjE (DUF340 family)
VALKKKRSRLSVLAMAAGGGWSSLPADLLNQISAA